MIPIQPSGKRETPRIELPPTNVEDWMLLSQRIQMFSSTCINNIITPHTLNGKDAINNNNVTGQIIAVDSGQSLSWKTPDIINTKE